MSTLRGETPAVRRPRGTIWAIAVVLTSACSSGNGGSSDAGAADGSHPSSSGGGDDGMGPSEDGGTVGMTGTDGGGGEHDATVNVVGPSPDVVCAADGGALATYDAVGTGTASNPYVLCNAPQLAELSSTPAAWKASFRLGADVDLSGSPFTMIGTTDHPFAGTFDGNGHVVSNFKLSNSNLTDAGFFGVVLGAAAEVRSLNLTKASVTASQNVGILVGRLERGARVLGSSTQGTVTGDDAVGGVVGSGQYGAVVSSSWSSATVTAPSDLGGLVGLDSQGLFIFNSYATGAVNGDQSAGGLVGSTDSGGVYRSYSTATVTSTSTSADGVGGLAGAVHGTIFEDCFATGTVSAKATQTVGKFGGDAPYGTFTNDFFLSSSTCQAGSGACPADPNAKSASQSQLQDKAQLPLSAWDLTHTWTVTSGAFPSLSSTLFDEQTWDGCAAHAGDMPMAGGDGTPNRPYLVCTAAQFAQLSTAPFQQTGVYVRQMATIDFSASSVTLAPIGTDNNPFVGVYDGHGKGLSNFTVHGDNGSVGLIASMTGAIIRASVIGGTTVGGSKAGPVGLLVGSIYGTVNDSYATGTVSGPDGVAPFGSPHTMVACYASATVTASSGSGAGLNAAGGNDGLTLDSFASSNVTGTKSFAAIPPVNSSAQVTDSFYDSSKCSGCSAPNVTGHPTSYFYSKTNAPLSTWDFDTVWQAQASGFPTLR